MLRLVVFLILLQHAHSYCMVTPDANGHVNATALSAELGESTVLGYAGVEGSTAAQNAGFYSCQALKTIEIPSSVETIGSFAFYNSGLTHLTIPSSVKTIRNDAYWKCDDLESVDFSLATQLATIGDYAFYDARALTSVDFSDATALTTIGVRAFKDTCLLSVPEHSATTVGTEAFSNICFHKCRLGADPPGMNITTGHGTYSDASQSFQYCKMLTSVKIEDDVEEIGSYAFKDTALTSVTVPVCTHIGTETFPSATNLVRSFPRACVDNYVSKGTSVSTVLDSFTPQELKAAYRAKNVCPS